MGEFTYTMFKNGEADVGGMYQIPAEKSGQIPPHWMSYIFVDSLEDTLSKVEALNGKVVQPITTVGEFGQMAVIQDPTGAMIALWHKS